MKITNAKGTKNLPDHVTSIISDHIKIHGEAPTRLHLGVAEYGHFIARDTPKNRPYPLTKHGEVCGLPITPETQHSCIAVSSP